MKKLYLFLILGVFLISLISFASATKDIHYDYASGRIVASSTDASDPVSFQDIYEYFQENPIPTLDFPQRLGGNPYELCENNSAEWFGRNGMSNATDDSTTYQENNYSIKATVLSLPSSMNITGSKTDGVNLYIYMSDTSNISLGDEVKLTRPDGTTVITKITYISTNSYIRGYAPRGFSDYALSYETGGKIDKPLSVIWNDDRSLSSFGVSLADQIRFSAKSNGTSNPKITDVIVRNTYTDSNPNDYSHLVYGAYKTEDFNLTNDWQNFTIDIRSMLNYLWRKDYSARGYWSQVKKVYFFFDNLSVGDEVWLDGVRFTDSNPNPENPAQNNYVFKTGLYVQKYFKDYGFNVRFDLLDTYGIASNNYKGYSPGVQFLNYGDYGDIQLGDYDGTSSAYGHEGGSMTFNHFCAEDSGALYLGRVESQGVTFQDWANAYGGWQFADAPNSIFRNCNFINNLNFFNPNNVSIENCAWMGGRYFVAFPVSMTINGVSIYEPNSYAFFTRRNSAGTLIPFKNVKIFGKDNFNVANVDNWGSTPDNSNTSVRFINFDISEINDPILLCQKNYAYDGNAYDTFAFTFNLKVTDENNNNLENANVTLKDKDGNVLFSVLTDSNGTIPEQYVDYYNSMQDISGYIGTSHYFRLHFENESQWTTYFPYTLTIEKDGYSSYEKKFFDHYDKTSDIVKKGADWMISLSKPSPASLILDKIATIENITNSTINYNITLRITNKGQANATSTNITDSDSSYSPYNLGTLQANSSIEESYIKSYTRNSTTYNITLAIANASAIDSRFNDTISANSTQLILAIPATTPSQQLTLIKNIYYNSENSTHVNYTVSTEIVNSGGEDLSSITVLDSDLNLNTNINLNRTQEYNYSNFVLVEKAASNTNKLFAKTSATANSVTYQSNQIQVRIPGYGGPADVAVYAPASVQTSTSFSTIINVVNQNPDIGQDFTIDYWITNNAETVNYSSGQQTIYVPASDSSNLTAILSSPSSAGTYKFHASVSWVRGTASAFDSFIVTAPSVQEPSGGGGSAITGKATQQIVCNPPYIRNGEKCCLDENNNSICDTDEQKSTSGPKEKKENKKSFEEHILNFFEKIKENTNSLLDHIKSFSHVKSIKKKVLFIFFGLISLIIIFLFRKKILLLGKNLKIKKKIPEDSVKGLRNKKVYTEEGEYLGKIKEIILGKNKIDSLKIKLSNLIKKEKRIRNKGILMKYRHVRDAKNIVIVDKRIPKYLEKHRVKNSKI